MKYSAVVFDLDGTLLDTIGDIADSMNHALGLHGFPIHGDREYYDMVGWGLDVLVSKAVPPDTFESSDDPEGLRRDLKSRFMEYYREHPADRTVPFDGVEELLPKLVEANISLGVLSNKPDELVQQVVDALLPRNYFASVLGRSDDFPHKPEPDSLHHILEELNLDPRRACMVGDSEIDMETARNAGVAAVAVSWGFRSLETLLKAGAEATMHSVRELEDYLLKD